MGKISQLLGVKNVIVVFLLSLMFLNFKGYWYVFAVLPIVYALFFHEVYRLYDKVFVLLILFGFWYIVFAPSLDINRYVVFVLIYPLLYLVGKYIGRTESDKGETNTLFIMALSMAVIYLHSIMGDVVENGFYADSRNIEIEGLGNDEEISATGIYSHMMLLTTFIAALFTRMSLKRRFVFTIFAILAFVASIRIQSRTSIVIMIIVIVLSLLVNFRTIVKRNFIMVTISLGVLLFAANYAMTNYEEELGILDRFQDEDVETGGNRSVLAGKVLSELTEYPFGIPHRMSYAHNLWLDAARVAGVVPLFILLIITIFYIRSLWCIYRHYVYYDGDRNMILIIGVALFAYMNVEPILEGCPLLFAYFVMLLGMMRENLVDNCRNLICK